MLALIDPSSREVIVLADNDVNAMFTISVLELICYSFKLMRGERKG
jgi:hypothetical protein